MSPLEEHLIRQAAERAYTATCQTDDGEALPKFGDLSQTTQTYYLRMMLAALAPYVQAIAMQEAVHNIFRQPLFTARP